jgi:hypothetical protein
MWRHVRVRQDHFIRMGSSTCGVTCVCARTISFVWGQAHVASREGAPGPFHSYGVKHMWRHVRVRQDPVIHMGLGLLWSFKQGSGGTTHAAMCLLACMAISAMASAPVCSTWQRRRPVFHMRSVQSPPTVASRRSCHPQEVTGSNSNKISPFVGAPDAGMQCIISHVHTHSSSH